MIWTMTRIVTWTIALVMILDMDQIMTWTMGQIMKQQVAWAPLACSAAALRP
jgi:hypothetical protein